MLAQHLTPSSHPPANHGRNLHLRSSPQTDRLKRVFDLLVAMPLSVLAIPVIAMAWSLVRATSAGVSPQLSRSSAGRTEIAPRSV